MFATTTSTTTTTVRAVHVARRSTTCARGVPVVRASSAVCGGVSLQARRRAAIAGGGAIGDATKSATKARGRRGVVTCVTRGDARAMCAMTRGRSR